MAALLNSAVVYLFALDAISGLGVRASARPPAEFARPERPLSRRTVRRALARAHRGFARQHSGWAASLFDEHFVTHRVEPLLFEGLSRSSLPAPADLARAWAEQFGSRRRDGQPEPGADVVRVSADFLARLAIELGRNS